MLFGAIIAAFGFKILKYTLMIIGFVAGFLFTAVIVYVFVNLNGLSTSATIGMIVGCVIVGVLLGFVFFYFTKVTSVLTCGFLCFTIGYSLITMIFAS